MKKALILIGLTALLVFVAVTIKERFRSDNNLEKLGNDLKAEQQDSTNPFVEPKPTVSTSTDTNTTTKTTPAPKPLITKDGVYLVYYNSTGFSPISLTIPVTKSVRFINNSNKAMLIYANNQQDRTLAAINQSKSVGYGGVYNFMFTKPGIYGYYNLNNPKDTGVITVK